MKKLFLFLVVINLNVWFCISKTNAQYTGLLDFSGTVNGSFPEVSLASDGTFLYGQTYQGGANNKGVIFKIMPDGSGYAKLLDFAGAGNGSYPTGALLYNGSFLYGMTQQGGVHGMGTIFKIMPDGTGYSKLLDFAGTVNGRYPQGSLISDGTFLYGMSFRGGIHDSGTVFKIMPDGTGFSRLLDFAGASNGTYPYSSLFYSGTFLYGMTNTGGTNDLGTIFKIMTDGTGYIKLLDFTGTVNGATPSGTFISDGTFLYGLTKTGGTNNLGTVFKIMPDGSGYMKLLDFSGTANGRYPFGSLIMDGNFLFGMTEQGGLNDMGTLFKIMPDGSGYSALLDFAGTVNGSYPYGSLFSDGSFLYGTTEQGGANGMGTVFKFRHIVTGIAENNDESYIHVYPNPFNGIFNVKGLPADKQQSTITVYDVLGQNIYSTNLKHQTTNEINLSDFPKGIYFMKVCEGDKIYTKKMLLQ